MDEKERGDIERKIKEAIEAYAKTFFGALNCYYYSLYLREETRIKKFDGAWGGSGTYTEFQPTNPINSDQVIPHFCESCGRIEGVQAHFDDCPNNPPQQPESREGLGKKI